jgi:hypothetical protein
LLFVTGSFFPALFEAAAHNPLTVFAMDAVGAALGSLTAFFIPIALGFSYFFPTTCALFMVTDLATYLFFRKARRTQRAPLRIAPYPPTA